jgi:Replication initiation factor
MTPRITATIDWLTCTFEGTRTEQMLYTFLDSLWGKLEAHPAKPSTGYAWAIQATNGLLLQSGNREDMHTNMMASGAALSSLSEVIPGFPDSLSQCLLKCRNASRIDLAIDVRNLPFLRAAIDMVRAEHYTCAAKTFIVVDGSDKGLTLYLGSRSSERMLRVYDKAVQMGDDGAQWERIELEIKGDAATRAARAIALYGVSSVAKAWICEFAHFDHPAWNEIENSGKLSYEPSQRKQHDGRTWLLTSIAAIIAKRIMAGDDTLLGDISDAVTALLH